MSKRSILCLATALASTVAFPAVETPAPAAPAPAEGPRAVARVNGEPILAEHLESWLVRAHGEAEEQRRGGFDLHALVDRMIDELLLAQEARALDMHLEEPTRGQVRRYREGLLRERFERREVLERATASEEELRAEFRSAYRRVDLTVLTVDARERALELLEAIRDGADMSELARTESVDPYGPRGGRVAGLPRLDLDPDVAEAAFALGPGGLGGPVRTDLGWSVLRVDAFADADPESFEGRRAVVANIVRARKVQQLRAELAAKLEQDHPVTIVDAVVDAIRPQRFPDGRLVPTIENPEAVAVRIGESHTITAGEFGYALLLRWSGVRSFDAAVASAPMVLRQLIRDGLVIAEIARSKPTADPEIETPVRGYENRLLAGRYEREQVAPGIRVSPQEVRDVYDGHPERFRQAPRVHLRQITVRSREEAERIAGLLRQGADAAWLAREHSVDRFRETGGDRGWMVPRAGLDEINDLLITAVPGTVLGPFGVAQDYKVFRVTATQAQPPVPFEQAAADIERGLRRDKLDQARTALLRKLRERSEIVVDEALLASMRVVGSAGETR